MHSLRRSPRRWSLATWLLVASGVTAVVICLLIGLRPYTENSPASGQVVVPDDMTRSFDIAYPVLHLPEIDPQLRSFAEKQTDKFVAKVKDQQYTPQNKLTLTYDIAHFGEQTLSVVFTKKEELVDTKPTTTHYRFVFDIKSGKQLAVKSIFRDAAHAQAVLASVFYDYFQQNNAGFDPGQQLKLLDFRFDNVEDFLLYKDSIVLRINPKDLANKKQAVSVEVNKNVVASILKEAYAGSDTSRDPDTPAKNIAYKISELPKRSEPNTGGKRLALTFDDGPGASTPRLLDALAKYRSKATFYVLGHLAHAYAGELQRMVREGHEIGNHTWLHANLTTLSHGELEQQIGDTQRAIQQATGGYSPRTVRPPYGATNTTVKAFVTGYGLQEVLWSVDTNDWQIHNSKVVYDRIMSGAADGGVILLHDIHAHSVDAAIRAIPDLLAQGYQLVTVSEL